MVKTSNTFKPKPEPLNGKWEKNYLSSPQKIGFYTKDDIASAVEWLKEEYKEVQDNEGNIYIDYESFCAKVDETFVDVVKPTTPIKEAK